MALASANKCLDKPWAGYIALKYEVQWMAQRRYASQWLQRTVHGGKFILILLLDKITSVWPFSRILLKLCNHHPDDFYVLDASVLYSY